MGRLSERSQVLPGIFKWIRYFLIREKVIEDNENKDANTMFWIDKYCSRMGYNGGRSERILFVNENWKQFKAFAYNGGLH